MSALENLTDLAAACIPSMSRNDRLLTLVVISGRFSFPDARAPGDAAPRLMAEQGEVRLADEYVGDPGALSLLYEGQSAYTRPGTDLYMHGRAWAPGGRATRQSVVELRVGPCSKRALVFGDRIWDRTITGVAASPPAAFESMPLNYLRCFGGSPARPSRTTAKAAEYNPVGCGLHDAQGDAIGRPLPNFEDPHAPLTRPGEQPRPCGFGPVARHWLPRRAHGGTYDASWAERRLPLWPKDFNEQFFSAAAPGLLAAPHLEGGELVQIVGMSPRGSYEFSLPRVPLRVRFALADRSVHRDPALDAIHFEPDSTSFTMYWRAAVAADPLSVRAVVVRTREPWEVLR